jgi:hypothetical protein
MMTAAAGRAESSNDTVLLRLPAPANALVLFGGQVVGEDGLRVQHGATAVLTVTNAGRHAQHYPGFTVVRTVAELESYAIPAQESDQKRIRASSGATAPSLTGPAMQISRGQTRAVTKLAMQSPGSNKVEIVESSVTNATGGVMSSSSTRITTAAIVPGSRIERIVWCEENGAINVFMSAPRAGAAPE